MRLLWTLLKVVVALALAIPLSIILMATVLGVFGALLGLAFLALRLAVVGLVIWGIFWLFRAMFGGWRRKSQPAPPVLEFEPIDPYYEQARRELDRELGDAR